MNIKDLLFTFGLALLTTWAIQYFFFSGNKSAQSMADRSGQSFIAPDSPVEYKPLVREIDFIDERRGGKPELSTVNTPLGTYVFSTDGACLYRFDAKREIDGAAKTLTTIFPLPETEKEGRCFLIALPEKTPYFYRLIDRQDESGLTSLTYAYASEQSPITITKKFTIFHDSHRIDVETTAESKNGSEQSLRMIVPSPLMPEIAAYDSIQALVAGATGSLQKVPLAKVTPQSGWFTPAIFGTENKYFVHALVEQAEPTTQRGYYAPSHDKLMALLESKTFTQKLVWNASFYIGPKDEAALTIVSPRLEEALEYSGWLAPIAKLALAVLKWIYSYVKNYGLAIILLTILMKLLMVPFTWRAEQSVKKRLEFQKRLQYLQQKYKHEPEMLRQEQAELIKKHGMPGLSGCLPILIQIPLFFGLNRVLSSSIELYKAPFVGWITDLSASDPYYVLPILIVLMMLLQAASADSQQRFMVIAMALVFGAVSVNLSAGLCLYIVVSTLLSVLQTSMQRFAKAA